MTEQKKPAAKATAKKKAPLPWSYDQQLSFQHIASQFVRAQQQGDQRKMAELADRIAEDLKLGQGL